MLIVWKSFATTSHHLSKLTSMSHKDASSVHQRPQSRVGFLQRHQIMLAEPQLEVLMLESAESRQVVGDGVLAENVVVDEHGEIARETRHATQLQIGFLPHDPMAVGSDVRLRRRGSEATPAHRSAR